MPVLAALVGATLLVIAALHLVWVASPWPLATRADLARDVVGRPDGSLPRAQFVPATLAVGVALGVAALLVAQDGGALASPLSEGIARGGTWVVAAVFGARGVFGLVESSAGLGDHPASYRRLDLRIYSPLCLVLGVLTALVALT